MVVMVSHLLDCFGSKLKQTYAFNDWSKDGVLSTAETCSNHLVLAQTWFSLFPAIVRFRYPDHFFGFGFFWASTRFTRFMFHRVPGIPVGSGSHRGPLRTLTSDLRWRRWGLGIAGYPWVPWHPKERLLRKTMLSWMKLDLSWIKWN